jgi:hypothetical protein
VIKMVKMFCPQCNHRRSIPESELEYGMLCPKCHCQNLKRVEKLRRDRAVEFFRPVTIRSFVGGFICLLLGPICIAMAWPNLGTRAAVLWARVFAFGILLLIAAVLSFATGFYWLYRDYTD